MRGRGDRRYAGGRQQGCGFRIISAWPKQVLSAGHQILALIIGESFPESARSSGERDSRYSRAEPAGDPELARYPPPGAAGRPPGERRPLPGRPGLPRSRPGAGHSPSPRPAHDGPDPGSLWGRAGTRFAGTRFAGGRTRRAGPGRRARRPRRGGRRTGSHPGSGHKNHRTRTSEKRLPIHGGWRSPGASWEPRRSSAGDFRRIRGTQIADRRGASRQLIRRCDGNRDRPRAARLACPGCSYRALPGTCSPEWQ
jgi:hypothetical protein